MDAAQQLQPDDSAAEPRPALRLAYMALTDPAHWFGELVLELTEEDVGA